jgi:hypothetical protein
MPLWAGFLSSAYIPDVCDMLQTWSLSFLCKNEIRGVLHLPADLKRQWFFLGCSRGDEDGPKPIGGCF